MKFHITDDLPEAAGTTVGFWAFEGPKNSGTLHIYCKPLPDRRFLAAVIGHELLEAAYCKLFGIETSVCDKFDTWMEHEYELGHYPYTFEGGFHPKCPYRWGHIVGCGFEYLCVYGTFGSWREYGDACEVAMDL